MGEDHPSLIWEIQPKGWKKWAGGKECLVKLHASQTAGWLVRFKGDARGKVPSHSILLMILADRKERDRGGYKEKGAKKESRKRTGHEKKVGGPKRNRATG